MHVIVSGRQPVKLRRTTTPGITVYMELGFFRRPLLACVASALIYVSVLLFGGTFKVLPGAHAATTQHSVPAAPACTRPLTVNSNPCNAKIYIDGIEVGRTPMTFPMPTGRYTLVVVAPGHQTYAQRILVPDAPLKIEANLVPLR